MIHRPQDAVRLPLAREAEMVVDRADDEVELAQASVGQIERAVLENVDFRGLVNDEKLVRAVLRREWTDQ
jgi:hypothetical protein